MGLRDTQAVSKSLEAYLGKLIAESNFFSDLSTGRASFCHEVPAAIAGPTRRQA